MSSIRISSASPVLVIDGSNPCFFSGVLGREGEWLAFEKASAPALESLFQSVDQVLGASGIELHAIRSYLYCQGPGSILGLRLCAMAIETWRRLHPEPALLFAYNSLEFAAYSLLHQHPSTEQALLVSDWKKDTWNSLQIEMGQPGPVTTIQAEELAAWEGPLYHLPARKGWQKPPAQAIELSYEPELLPTLCSVTGLIKTQEEVSLYSSGLNHFQKWWPERHRAVSGPATGSIQNAP